MLISSLGDIVPSTPDPKALLAQAQLLEAQNRLQAAQMQQATLANQAAAANMQNAAAAPVSIRIPREVAPVWHQDVIKRPATSGSARISDTLAAVDKMHAAYIFPFQVTAAGGVFSQTFPIELNRAFYISNVAMQKFITGTQVVSPGPAGFVDIRDNATGYSLLDQLPCNCFGAISLTQVRTIWPLPYGIGAGGSFEVKVTVPVTAGLTTYDTQVIVEGWWDFTHMDGRTMIGVNNATVI